MAPVGFAITWNAPGAPAGRGQGMAGPGWLSLSSRRPTNVTGALAIRAQPRRRGSAQPATGARGPQPGSAPARTTSNDRPLAGPRGLTQRSGGARTSPAEPYLPA